MMSSSVSKKRLYNAGILHNCSEFALDCSDIHRGWFLQHCRNAKAIIGYDDNIEVLLNSSMKYVIQLHFSTALPKTRYKTHQRRH